MIRTLRDVAVTFAVVAATTTMLGSIYIAQVEAQPGVTIDRSDLNGVPEQPCYEDERCWDPATMGNGLGHLPAGAVPIPGDHSLVSP